MRILLWENCNVISKNALSNITNYDTKHAFTLTCFRKCNKIGCKLDIQAAVIYLKYWLAQKHCAFLLILISCLLSVIAAFTCGRFSTCVAAGSRVGVQVYSGLHCWRFGLQILLISYINLKTPQNELSAVFYSVLSISLWQRKLIAGYAIPSLSSCSGHKLWYATCWWY